MLGYMLKQEMMDAIVNIIEIIIMKIIRNHVTLISKSCDSKYKLSIYENNSLNLLERRVDVLLLNFHSQTHSRS